MRWSGVPSVDAGGRLPDRWSGVRSFAVVSLGGLLVLGCTGDPAGPLDSGAAADARPSSDAGHDSGIPRDSGAGLDAGPTCGLTLADTHCPATYPAVANSGCGFEATRAVMCGSHRSLFIEPGFGATTCCYDGNDTLIGATMRSDIPDECYRSTGQGPAVFLGSGCCLGWADTACADAGVGADGGADGGVGADAR